MTNAFWNLITSKSGLISVGSTTLLTAGFAYYGTSFFLQTGGTINVPLYGPANGPLGLALYAGLGAFAGAALNQYVLPMLPGSAFTGGIGRTVIGPAITGASMYGLMMFSSPNSASNIGIVNVMMVGGVSNLLATGIAQAWNPWLQRMLGS
jgi:hypothetical protein